MFIDMIVTKLINNRTTNYILFFSFFMFFSFKIFQFGERNLIKIFKIYIDDKIYACEISLDSS